MTWNDVSWGGVKGTYWVPQEGVPFKISKCPHFSLRYFIFHRSYVSKCLGWETRESTFFLFFPSQLCTYFYKETFLNDNEVGPFPVNLFSSWLWMTTKYMTLYIIYIFLIGWYFHQILASEIDLRKNMIVLFSAHVLRVQKKGSST